MIKKKQSFDELKRKVYLVVLPCILLNNLVTLFIQIKYQDYHIGFYTNVLFIFIFTVGWFVAYFNRWIGFFELAILSKVFLFHMIAVFLAVRNHINMGTEELESFIIWLPVIIIYIFVVLNRKRAIWVSVALLLGTIFPAIYYYQHLSAIFLESLNQLYLATIVYIIVLTFSFKLFQTQAEIEYMQRQLYLDPLTQVGNRLQIDEWLHSSLEDAKKDQLSIIFFDIDRFKSVNDRYGHQVGDEVLRKLTHIVQGVLEKHHYFGRWGGEEFIILLHVPECEAYAFAEKVRHVIESYEFDEIGQVTASFGVTGFNEEDTVDSILFRADQRLYESKKSGRNRVTGKL